MLETIQPWIPVDFIHKWQPLIGSTLGPFLAITLSLCAFYIKEKYQKRKERKECIRRVEVGLAQTLNHIFTSLSQLDYFVDRVKTIISEIEGVTDPTMYAINETNFPPIINIHFDEELSKMKFGSYYLHNKILIIEYLVRWTNSTIAQFREDFSKLLKKSEFLILQKVTPTFQREAYVENLKGFISMVETFLTSLRTENVKSIAQAKVYNLKLMKKYFMTLWKHEKIDFRYFKTRKEIEKYRESLDALDRINNLIEVEVNKLIFEAEERAKENAQNA